MKHQVNLIARQMKNGSMYWFALLFLAMEATPTYGQNRVIFDLTTNPYAWASDAGSAQLQVQAFPRFAVCAGGSFGMSGKRLQDFDQHQNTIRATLELRWLPFGSTTFGKKKAPSIQKICGGKYGCLDQRSRIGISQLLKGIYLAPGYQFERVGIALVPLPHLESPIPEFQYKIVGHAFTLNAGYQVRLGNITLGAGYGWAIDQPCWSGPYDIFGDSLYTQTYPWKMRVRSSLRFEVGVNF